MHEQVAEIVLRWRLVLLSGQTTQPFVEKINSQWVHAAEEDVDSQVELKLVD